MDPSSGCASMERRPPVSPRTMGLPQGQLEGAAGAFGLKVHVQGTDGHSFVVLNKNQSMQCYGGPEVTFVEHCSQSTVYSSTGGGYRPEMLPHSPRQTHVGGSHSDLRAPPPGATSPLLNYQRHPELLRPYHPQDNSLELDSSRGPRQQPSPIPACSSEPLRLNPPASPQPAYSLVVHKARIPLPLAAREQAKDRPQVKGHASSQRGDPAQPPHVASKPATESEGGPGAGSLTGGFDQTEAGQSAGRSLIGGFDQTVGARSQMSREERRRSRSADNSASSDPVATETARGIRGDVGVGSSAPVSPRPRAMNGGTPGPEAGGEGAERAGPQRADAPEQKCPKPAKVLLKVEKTESRSVHRSGGLPAPERDKQVTPDLLRGQRKLPPNTAPVTEGSAKQALFTYLKLGTADTDDVIRRKVKKMFEKIHLLKSWGAEKLEELPAADSEREVRTEREVSSERRGVLEIHASQLKKQLEEEIKRVRSSAEVCTQTEQEGRRLQEELCRRKEEQENLRQQLTDKERDLQAALQQLQQVRRERERCCSEIRDLQQQLSEMHDELDEVKEVEAGERQNIMKDLVSLKLEFQEVLTSQEAQEDALRRKERELTALRGALEEEITAHAEEVTTLKETREREVQQMQWASEEARRRPEREVQPGAEGLEQEVLSRQVQVQEVENRVIQLRHLLKEAESREDQLRERTHTLLEEKEQLEVSLEEARQQEEDLCGANQALTRHLEDTQSELRCLGQEHKELQRRLREEGGHVEELKKERGLMEEERRKQDTVMEQLQEEMILVVQESERSTLRLQEQVDEARGQMEGKRSDLLTQLQERRQELDTQSQHNKRLHKELTQLEAQLQQCENELDEAELKSRKLEKTLKELEEQDKSGQEDRGRLTKLLEVRVAQLEDDLREERANEEQMMQRLERGREQMEQARAELLQEKAARQDLECDKISLERQNRDLKSRVTHLEGSQRSGQDGLVSRLEGRIQELEARLEGEERESASLQQANRKLERKLKEMMMQVGEEQLSLKDQRDQLTLRLKTLKRQLDEAEEEIERVENSKRKIQRELDEQQEANQQLHTHMTELRSDMRRKRAVPLMKTLADEEEEEEVGGSD